MKLRANLDKRMVQLEHRLIKMTSLVEQSIRRAMDSIKNNDDQLAVEVIEADRMVDQLEMSIEKNCINVISLQQPIATDLREVTAILKIITDLERIGDYAVNIAKLQISLQSSMSDQAKYLDGMVDNTIAMLQKVLEAFINRNPDLAREAALTDTKVDDAYEEVYHFYLDKLKQNQASTDELVPLLFIGRYLERIGDHITNICERVIYMIEGIHEYY